MKIVRGCKCGQELTEKNFTGPMGRPQLFGLPKGMMGNSRARFIKMKCKDCGLEYLGECVPGKTGGSMRLNRIMDMDDKIEVKPPQPKPKPAPEPSAIPEPDELVVEDEQQLDPGTEDVEANEISTDSMTRAQLLEMAKVLDVPGLSRMTKAELVSVLTGNVEQPAQ